MTAPERDSEHEAVGAYALGVLDAADAARFEEHLAGCPSCQEELGGFLELEPLLAALAESPGDLLPDPEPLHARPSPQLLDRLLDEVAADRRKRHRRGLWLAVAAAVLIVGGPLVATAVTSHDSGSVVARPPHAHATGPAEDAFFHHMEEKIEATDPVTKVDATVGLERKPWGTHAVLELKNVKGPLTCSLIAVSRTGEEQTVTTWAVPAWGYGIPDSAHRTSRYPLYAHGGAAMALDEIDHFEIRTLDGRRLVRIDA